MASQTELPLLTQRRPVLSDARYGSSESAESSSPPSTVWRRSRSLLQRVAPIVVWVAVGCGASLFVQHRSAAVVDWTHGERVQHSVYSELDAIASSCPNAGGNTTEKKPKAKDTHWFLGGADPELVLSSIPPVSSVDDLPTNWDWRDYNGTGISLVTSIQNQMVPRPCGSCWAFSTVSALSDRIRIAQFRKYGKVGPEVLISPQVLLDCGMRSFGSCTGGDPRYAHKWIHENGIVDTTCNPYIASHPSWFDSTESCGASQCRRCTLTGECKVDRDAKRYRISEYGTLNATTPEEFEVEAMNEIYHRGPIVVSMYSLTPDFADYPGGFVLRNPTKFPSTTHVVSLVGWGTDENGVKFWIVRNTHGTNWGEDGFFRAERGVNAYNLELHGAWAVPIV
ncbi:hypothetical protein P43SY_003909 [Pythium insidiosum]|uniref:Peptidase C1A papain C-terminal domain-containing protein n=1 Tax=Pythium insidiosum TaxID=114742 RepID=A0AAD5LJT8_PYTIN|nr:hypothetical protein P43SY_003909 [Pythium insidiosum]